ncbi:hypothetical protein NL676_027158 [Syzygium grande]|nr:hypothetical protein NL676_027158 [Syzygium grande]
MLRSGPPPLHPFECAEISRSIYTPTVWIRETALPYPSRTFQWLLMRKRRKDSGFKLSRSSLSNVQTGQGNMTVKNNLVASGFGSTQQVYKYRGGELCYYRNVSSSNYTILHDHIVKKCKKGAEPRYASRTNRRWPSRIQGFI